MPIKDLHELPKLRDGLSFLYVEHARVEQEQQSIAIYDKESITPVPAAALAALMLGPGTSITHAAVKALADNGCSIIWCGEGQVRMYAAGTGETRKTQALLRQAELATNPAQRLIVVERMYRMRFKEKLPTGLTLEQIRGMEGVRIRDAYSKQSEISGVPWYGRSYQREEWSSADPVNRALSSANSCLYGVCHACIISAGYSPGLGFVHTGKTLSFVYDVADFYKTETTIPLAFAAVAENAPDLERTVRKKCRDYFKESKLLQRVIPDIQKALNVEAGVETETSTGFDSDPAAPCPLWDPDEGEVDGGKNYGDDNS